MVRVLRGDITRLQVDAIVNAANSHLAGGGGVDGAIHRAGGPEIKAETRRRFSGGCPTGEAVTTSAGSVAFPSISTGTYGFPVERAAGIAMGEVRRALAALPPGGGLEVIVCAFGAGDEDAYRRAAGNLID